MEVIRNFKPENNFLNKVRELATRKGIVLIFDECTSGFRETFGGIYQKYNVTPDMIMYGKTLGNGYAITAVVGKEDVMDAAQNTFISSTFWTERIGPTAAIKTLEIMDKIKSWEIITSKGKKVQEGWKKLASKYNINIKINGIPALSSLIFDSQDHLKYKTLISQEMLSKGYLAGTLFYASISHSDNIINKYITDLESIFFDISECEKGNKSIDNLLTGPVVHSGFNRLIDI